MSTTDDAVARTWQDAMTSWFRGQWLAVRVAAGSSLAEAAVIWLAIDALSSRSTGPIAIWPVIVAMLLIAIVPVLTAGASTAVHRAANVLTVLVFGTILVKGLSFPDLSWLDTAWLDGTWDAVLLHDSPAVMPVWIPMLITITAWWWRSRRAENVTGDVRLVFQLGAIVLVAVALIGGFSGMATQGTIAAAATIFFSMILLAMAWARQAAVHPGELSGGTGVATLTSLASVAVVLLAATALVALASPTAFETVIWLLTPLIWIVRIAVLGIAWVLVIILYPVFWLVSWLLAQRSTNDIPPTNNAPLAEPSAAPNQDVTSSGFVLPDDVRIIIASLVLGVIILLIARLALRRAAPTAGPVDVEQHMEIDLRSLLRRRPGHANDDRVDQLAGLRDDPRYRNTVAIREIYERFLRETARIDLARRRPETARRHARRVASVTGDAVADIQTLSNAYSLVRYGDAPASDDQRRAVETAWNRVAPRLRQVSDAVPTPATSKRRGSRR